MGVDAVLEPPGEPGLSAEGQASDVDGRGLGRLRPVANLRSIWSTEASDFPPWLFENLDLLANAIGVSLTAEQQEYPVGPFRLDILASDAAGRTVAIENQVEPADHNHLGQLLLYAAHVNAATAVWISPRFRDEQRQALLWLNENTVDGVRFFGVEAYIDTENREINESLFDELYAARANRKANSGMRSRGSAWTMVAPAASPLIMTSGCPAARRRPRRPPIGRLAVS